MALLDILTGGQGSSGGRVPPLAMARGALIVAWVIHFLGPDGNFHPALAVANFGAALPSGCGTAQSPQEEYLSQRGSLPEGAQVGDHDDRRYRQLCQRSDSSLAKHGVRSCSTFTMGTAERALLRPKRPDARALEGDRAPLDAGVARCARALGLCAR